MGSVGDELALLLPGIFHWFYSPSGEKDGEQEKDSKRTCADNGRVDYLPIKRILFLVYIGEYVPHCLVRHGFSDTGCCFVSAGS